MIKPTVGRVVWFFPKESEWRFGYSLAAGRAHAALITWVHSDTMVNLSVFDANGKQFSRTSVDLKQQESADATSDYCAWMPYQMGQAAKAEAAEKALTAKNDAGPALDVKRG